MLTENERKELFEKRQLCKEQETQVNKCSLEVASLEMKVSGLHERLAKVQCTGHHHHPLFFTIKSS